LDNAVASTGGDNASVNLHGSKASSSGTVGTSTGHRRNIIGYNASNLSSSNTSSDAISDESNVAHDTSSGGSNTMPHLLGVPATAPCGSSNANGSNNICSSSDLGVNCGATNGSVNGSNDTRDSGSNGSTNADAGCSDSSGKVPMANGTGTGNAGGNLLTMMQRNAMARQCWWQ